MARDLGEIALKNTPEIMGIMKGLLSLPNSNLIDLRGGGEG